MPPFELALEADLMGLAAVKNSPEFQLHVKKLCVLLNKWEGDWIESDYPENINTILKLLKTD